AIGAWRVPISSPAHTHVLTHTHTCSHTSALSRHCSHSVATRRSSWVRLEGRGTHTCAHTHTHTCAHTHTCTHTHTHTHTHTERVTGTHLLFSAGNKPHKM